MEASNLTFMAPRKVRVAWRKVGSCRLARCGEACRSEAQCLFHLQLAGSTCVR